MRDYAISPYVGALPLTFDQTPEEVGRVIGAPQSTWMEPSSRIIETRDGVNIGYLADEKTIFEIVVDQDDREIVNVWLNDMNLMRAENLVETLLLLDSEPQLSVGFIYFFALGISVADFPNLDDSSLSIHVFRRGLHDSASSRFIPYDQSNGPM